LNHSVYKSSSAAYTTLLVQDIVCHMKTIINYTLKNDKRIIYSSCNIVCILLCVPINCRNLRYPISLRRFSWSVNHDLPVRASPFHPTLFVRLPLVGNELFLDHYTDIIVIIIARESYFLYLPRDGV